MGSSCALFLATLLAVDSSAGAPAGAPEDEEAPGSAAEQAKAGAGVTPVELIPRLELRQSFAQLPTSASLHVTTTQLDIQFLNRLLLRYEGKLGVLSTPMGQVSGFGDAQLTAIGLLGASQRFVGVVLGGVILNSASQPPLGDGKTQLVFGGGAGWKPLHWLLPYVILQEQLSVAGEAARPDINQLDVRLGSVAFGPGYAWLKADLDTLIDFEREAGRFFGTLEAGRLLVGRVGLFMRAGTQLLGTRQVDYTLEVGVRYLFRLPKPP